jgi:hypothetical protein
MVTHANQFSTINTHMDSEAFSSSADEFSCERLGILVAHSLIQKQKVDLGESHYHCLNSSRTINPVKVIISTLPIALFYHDNETQLQSNLRQFVAWQDDPEIVAGILAVGYAIALSLQEKLQIASFIPLVTRFIEAPQSLLTQQLKQVKSLLEHQASLAKAVSVLGHPSSAIALAFYCFLSSLEDFQLSVKRAVICNPQISSITGALSGAYNTPGSIPVNWRLALSHSAQKPLVWGIYTEAEILQLCDSLVAVWSGAYNYTDTINEPMAIAAPQVIRPR